MPACRCDTEHTGLATSQTLSHSEMPFSGQLWATYSSYLLLPPALSSLLLLCLLENQFIWGPIVMVCFVFPPPCSSASIISDLHVYCLEVNSLSCSFSRYFLPEGLSFWHLENVISALPTDELQAAAANSTAPSFAVHTQTQQGRKESGIVWISFYTPRIFFFFFKGLYVR